MAPRPCRTARPRVRAATSAAVHAANAPRYAEAGIQAIDLTPAAVGPFVVPPVNLTGHIGAPNVNMVTCGGQATIPMVHAVSRVTPVAYAEIVATVASVSAGPGTRANIDEFTRTTAAAVRRLGGAARGKAIIILNPADPPLIMRDTIFCSLEPDADEQAVAASIEQVVAEVQAYVPGYRLLRPPQFDPAFTADGRGRVAIFIEVEGAGDHLPPYAGEPRHHDRRGDEGRRGARRRPGGALMPFSDTLDVRLTDSAAARRLSRGNATSSRRPTSSRSSADSPTPHVPVIEGDPRRRPRRVVVQLRVLGSRRATTHPGRRRHRRETIGDRRPDAPRRRHDRRHPRWRRPRGVGDAHRHALHRGRRVRTTLPHRP
ncbi:MAG: acetaldehyde dehydrogenase (acetylating) [Acidimicrobiales bacterium]